MLTHEDLTAHNTFDDPAALRPEPVGAEANDGEWRHAFPPASVTRFALRLR